MSSVVVDSTVTGSTQYFFLSVHVKEKFHIDAYFIVALYYYWCDTYWHLRHTYRPVSTRNSKILKIKNKNRNLLINK